MYIFIIFNIRVSKEYFYNLLGKDFVVSKIGNPSTRPLSNFFGAALGFVTGNAMERQYDRHSIVETSGQRLDTDTENIDADPHMSPEQKSAEKAIARAHYRQESGREASGFFGQDCQ